MDLSLVVFVIVGFALYALYLFVSSKNVDLEQRLELAERERDRYKLMYSKEALLRACDQAPDAEDEKQ